MLIDTHLHLYKEYYKDIDKVIKEAKENKVYYLINNGCEKNSNKEVIESIAKYQNVYGAIGIHPEEVENYSLEDIEYIKNNIDNAKIVAIGEIGLDYHYSKDNKEKQKELFAKQLMIAEENKLPVIVHSREATEDTINILKKYQVKGVIHSFSGSLEVAKLFIKMGFLLGINGVITFKNCNLKEIIKNIGLENIILETDAPYLTPVPNRGKQNSPKYILDIAEFIADVFDITLDEVATITTNNVKKLYTKMVIEENQ